MADLRSQCAIDRASKEAAESALTDLTKKLEKNQDDWMKRMNTLTVNNRNKEESLRREVEKMNEDVRAKDEEIELLARTVRAQKEQVRR